MDSEADAESIVAQSVQEYLRRDPSREPDDYKAQLQEETKRRGKLEQRVNELAEENRRSRQVAEDLE